MARQQLSVILLTTLRCNAACEYCFENRSAHDLTHRELTIIFEKLLNYAAGHDIRSLTVYWLGGEAMLLGPEWYLKARDIIGTLVERRKIDVRHHLQSNLLAYSPQWDRTIREMFDNHVGSSLDFPNLYRKVPGETPETYNDTWVRRFREATERGISVGVIAVANQETVRNAAEDFYAYYVGNVGVKNLQINTPFAGGLPNAVKSAFPLDGTLLARFHVNLADVWLQRRRTDRVKISPFGGLMRYFLNGDKSRLGCVWRESCGDEYLAIDPTGNVSACDCMAVSYPQFSFGNILECAELSEVMNSRVREQIRARPVELIRTQDCIDCDYLTLCHGGCVTRAYSAHGSISAKDPDCEVYRTIFEHMAKVAERVARENLSKRGVAVGDLQPDLGIRQ